VRITRPKEEGVGPDRALEAFLSAAQAEMAQCPPRKIAAWRSYWHAAIPYTQPADEAHLLDGLRKAGLSD
jgi:hypothetical protein